MSAHPILLAIPEYAEWEARRLNLDARVKDIQVRITAAEAVNRERQAENQRLVTAAAESGAAMPEPPEKTDTEQLREASAVLRRHAREHAELRRTLLVSIAPQIRAALREAEDARHTKIAKVLPTLKRAEREATNDAALARLLCNAEDHDPNRIVRPSRADRIPPPNLQSILAAVEGQVSLLDPVPLPKPLAHEVTEPKALGRSSATGYRPGYADLDKPPTLPVSQQLRDRRLG